MRTWYTGAKGEVFLNYGPISLLPIISKVLEKIISSQLKIFLFKNNLLPTAQFAYRAQHSTENAFVYAVNNLLHARDNREVSGLVFVDFSKAFDCVQHQLLIHELSKIGVRKSALQWFVDYLSDRSQQVHIGECSGPESVCSRGVPQGSVLGPLLFTLYIRSLPNSVDSSCLLFADDILLYCSSKDPDEIAAKLSNDVTKLHKWLGIRGLTMNVQKTKAMFVYPSRHDNLSADIEVECCGRPLDIVKSYKYLGVMLDSDLNWSAHMAYVARKVSWKIAALQRAGQKLNHAAKRQYYLSVIQSDLEYGSNAFFSSLSALAEKKLTGLYKRAIRAVAGLPPWSQVNSLELAKRFSLWPIIKRLKLKLLLFTFRCTHYLSSTLLSSQYNIRSHLNSTHSITRGQTYLSLSLYPK